MPLILSCQRSDSDSSKGVQTNAWETRLNLLESENKQLRDAIENSHDDVVAQLKQTLNEKGPSIWGCDDINATKVLKKKPMAGSNLPALIAAFNQAHASREQLFLQFKTLERDTVVITVDDPDLLTQQMGSTGAMCYLAGATFTLTSLNGIDSVWFDFSEGDHASPGRYDRGTFIDMITISSRDRGMHNTAFLSDAL